MGSCEVGCGRPGRRGELGDEGEGRGASEGPPPGRGSPSCRESQTPALAFLSPVTSPQASSARGLLTRALLLVNLSVPPVLWQRVLRISTGDRTPGRASWLCPVLLCCWRVAALAEPLFFLHLSKRNEYKVIYEARRLN